MEKYMLYKDKIYKVDQRATDAPGYFYIKRHGKRIRVHRDKVQGASSSIKKLKIQRKELGEYRNE